MIQISTFYSNAFNIYQIMTIRKKPPLQLFQKDSCPFWRAKADDRPETEDGGTQENRSRREDRRAEKDANIKRMRRRRSNIARIALGVIFGIAVAFIVASIIHGQVQLTELNQEISDAKAQLAEQQSVYTQLEMKVDSSISTTVVEDYAKNNLSMNKATNSQKEFIQLSDSDKAEVTLKKDKNLFETIAEAVSSLWS